MKIAMIGLRGIPSLLGGVETAVQELSVRLAALGHDVTVYCRPHYHPGRPVEFDGVHLRYLPSINTKHLETFSHSFLATLDVAFGGYDIVHIHAQGSALFGPLLRLQRGRLVDTVQGLDWQRAKWSPFAARTLRLAEKCSARFPHRTIVVSKKLQRYYRQEHGTETTYIPNGVNRPDPVPLGELEQRFSIEPENYLLFLARIVPEKGCHYLIDAYRQLQTDKKLVIVGSCVHSLEYIEHLKARADGDPRIVFTGPLYGEDKAAIMSNAFLYIHPSEIEGLPISLLEAMSYGRPVLISDIEENLEVLEGSPVPMGTAFRSADIADLREKIDYLIRHPESRGPGPEAIADFITKKYNWNDITQQTLDVYNETLARQRS